MIPDAYSIRQSLQGILQDFIRASGFKDTNLEDVVREFVGILASYREEDLPLYPEVYLFHSENGLKALAPSSEQFTIGTADLCADAAQVIVKNCAALAENGWAIFVVRDHGGIRYGVFRSLLHAFATGAEEAMPGLGQDEPVLLIRNRGHLTVELRSTAGVQFTASLKTAHPEPSRLPAHVANFVEAATTESTDKQNFPLYLARLLTSILQHCHGTLLAVVTSGTQSAESALSDAVWPSPKLNLPEAYANARKNDSAEALATLQATEALLKGMIGSDGVVVFAADGTVLGYRLFLKPNADEAGRLPAQGGGRRRAYELMKIRIPSMFKATLIRSQDGETECTRQADE